VLVAAGKWHVWDGRRWVADEADVYRFACGLSRIIADEAREVVAKAKRASEDDGSSKRVEDAQKTAEVLLKWAVKSEMKGAIEAAVGLARKMLSVDAELLDADPWLLNCANGVVDLRTGVLGPHDASLLMTKMCPVEYVPGARSTLWERVLSDVVLGDTAMLGFLQRWFGYCATGLTHEQVLVVHWGDGSNGKSTVLGTLGKVLGDYAGTAAPGLLASADRSESHPTEIAALRGRRMVTAHESREGVHLREDFVKQATGGDRLSARFMREDFFEFDPTHKIQLLTNHKPTIRGQDRGIWRRVCLVPYRAMFGTAEQVRSGEATAVKDETTAALLAGEAELRGVLAWLVRGAVAWAQDGLRQPDAVQTATATYRGEQDRVGQFLLECCDVALEGAPGSVSWAAAGGGHVWFEPLTNGMGGLYFAYSGWCKESGFYALSKKRFTEELKRARPLLHFSEGKVAVSDGPRRKILRIEGLKLLPE
jgi:putative DNA primase/helicase